MSKPMWYCGFDECNRPGVRILGDCVLCNRHLCFEHLQKSSHTCATSEDDDIFYEEIAKAEKHEVAQLIKSINLEWLTSRASSLRNNTPCHIEDPTKDANSPMMGGMNLHLPITFTDGIKWLARIRRINATSPPPELQIYILKSEIATLQFLETINIPTAKVYDYSVEGANSPARVSYILMDFMSGAVLDWSSISEHGKEKVVAQLADIYVELGKHEFPAMGCLDQIGTKHIGPLTRECLTDFTDNSRMQPLGPFTHLQDYYHSCISLLLDLIYRREIYTDHPVEMYLIYKFLYDRVSEIYPKQTEEEEEIGFYLTHADDKGFHILVDADSNITGLIDWEWAFTAPKTLAFISPMLLLPTSEFFDGETNIDKDEVLLAECLEEKGAKEMAKCVREGRRHHQFAFLCTLDFCLPFGDLVGLFKGLRMSMKVDREYDWEEWKQLSLKRYDDDDRLRDILQRSKG
ncbi:hypothetical protein E4T44_07386 [Aureobasidium sp. EXF-8845]|nr:hypothetical protein E4T44_07386 [Aureobasidium sp. EXF-8845]KAI4846261.1 hypothetical protein E4T45_07328 [Aureobasidium sp. EXF-8846]